MSLVEPQIDRENGTYRFTVQAGSIGPEELARARLGTKTARGSNFVCLISGAPIPGHHVKAEGMAGRMGVRLMAVVAEGQRGRVYLNSTKEMEIIANSHNDTTSSSFWESSAQYPVDW